MKKNAIFALACMFAASGAYTADLSGSIGIGYDAAMQSVSCRYFLGNFGIDLLAGFYVEPQNVSLGEQQTKVDIRGALFALYAIEALEFANIDVFLGAEIEYVGSHVKGQGDLNVYARAGLAPELFVFENVSVEAGFGIELSVIEQPVPNIWKVGIGTYGSGVSIVSGLSFHWYFGKGSGKAAEQTE